MKNDRVPEGFLREFEDIHGAISTIVSGRFFEESLELII